jgi:hypothetical protein
MDSNKENIAALLPSLQREDGGWGYSGQASWTEPTALALLALSARNTNADAFSRGSRWLERVRRPDGGWAPKPGVEESTWVTALSVLAGRRDGVDWLMRQTGVESTAVQRVRMLLLGAKQDYAEGTVGWPWYPGTFAWVSPTAVTILALDRYLPNSGSEKMRQRIDEGRKTLLARACPDGGWNHGASRALGTDASSYPETTGLALLALRGVRSAKVDRGVAAAEKHMTNCRAAQGRSWLALALLAHGRKPEPVRVPGIRCRDAMDAAMVILAEAAMEGRNVFLERVA